METKQHATKKPVGPWWNGEIFFFNYLKINDSENTTSFSWRWCRRRRRKPLSLPKLKPKQRLWGPRRQCWKGSTATKTEDPDITHLLAAHTVANIQGGPNILGRTPRGETHLTTIAIIKFPLTTKSARKKTEDNTLVFTVDVKANKNQVK